MCVFFKLVFHVANNSDNDINKFRCIGMLFRTVAGC